MNEPVAGREQVEKRRVRGSQVLRISHSVTDGFVTPGSSVQKAQDT